MTMQPPATPQPPVEHLHLPGEDSALRHVDRDRLYAGVLDAYIAVLVAGAVLVIAATIVLFAI